MKARSIVERAFVLFCFCGLGEQMEKGLYEAPRDDRGQGKAEFFAFDESGAEREKEALGNGRDALVRFADKLICLVAFGEIENATCERTMGKDATFAKLVERAKNFFCGVGCAKFGSDAGTLPVMIAELAKKAKGTCCAGDGRFSFGLAESGVDGVVNVDGFDEGEGKWAIAAATVPCTAVEFDTVGREPLVD